MDTEGEKTREETGQVFEFSGRTHSVIGIGNIYEVPCRGDVDQIFDGAIHGCHI